MKESRTLIGLEEAINRINIELAKDQLKIVIVDPKTEEYLEYGYSIMSSSGKLVEVNIDICELLEKLDLIGANEELDYQEINKAECDDGIKACEVLLEKLKRDSITSFVIT